MGEAENKFNLYLHMHIQHVEHSTTSAFRTTNKKDKYKPCDKEGEF